MSNQPHIIADDCHITDETHDFLAAHGLEVRDLIYTDACKIHCLKVLCQKPQASPIEAPSKDHQSPLEAPLDCTSAKELEADQSLSIEPGPLRKAPGQDQSFRDRVAAELFSQMIMHKLSTFAQIDVAREAIEAKIRAEDVESARWQAAYEEFQQRVKAKADELINYDIHLLDKWSSVDELMALAEKLVRAEEHTDVQE